MTPFTDATPFWLGARRKSKDSKWQWTDGTAWDWQPLNIVISKESNTDCMIMYGTWASWYCEGKYQVVCAYPPVKMSGSHDLVFQKDSLIDPLFHFWWNPVREKGLDNAPGFKIEWKMETTSGRHKTVVSKNLTGSLSTPGLNSQATIEYLHEKQEFTAIIELPHNITDIIGDGALIVDVDIFPDREKQSEIKLLGTEFMPEFPSDNFITWAQAEEYCTSNGGELPSADGTFNNYRLQSYRSWALEDLMASLIALYGTEDFPIWVARPWYEDTCPVFLKKRSH